MKFDLANGLATSLEFKMAAEILKTVLVREMKELRKKYDMSMIMITHDLGIIAQMCDEVAVIYAGRIIEFGELREIFKDTKHPYTQGLFDSLPKINDEREMLQPIPGLMPDPMELPEGCAFAPRCKYATKKCKQGTPSKHYFSDTHYVACWRYDEPEFKL